MNVQLASIAVAPTLCVSTCWEATGVSAGVVMSLQTTGTPASVSAKTVPLFSQNHAEPCSWTHYCFHFCYTEVLLDGFLENRQFTLK